MSLINVSFPTTVESQTSPEMIWDALQSLPRDSLGEVLRFIQFRSWKSLNQTESVSDDQALWEAVQVNREYQVQHPEEPLERYSSGAEFLKTVLDEDTHGTIADSSIDTCAEPIRYFPVSV